MIRRGAGSLCVGLLGLAGVACQVGEGPAAPELLASGAQPVFVEAEHVDPRAPLAEDELPCSEMAALREPKKDGEDPARVPCPAEIAEAPSRYFDDRVSLHLPKGVSEDHFVEFTPSFARLSSEVESVSCSPGFPGAMITYMALFEFEDDPAKTNEALRSELLEVLGYQGARVCREQAEGVGRGARLILYAPASEGGLPNPGVALMRVVEAGERVVVVVYEVHPNAWTVMHQTLEASADSLVATGP